MARQQTIPLHEPPSAERAFAATALDAEGPAIEHPIAAADSLVGQRIDHFQIHELLGEGGMGAVYLAHDMSLERTVAIKVLRRELANDERLVGRLVMEAQAQACLQHPSVVTIYYIGNFQGAPYFAMEHVPGGTLAEYIQREGPLPWGEALEYIIQATRALAAAHGRGMVHRTSSRPTCCWARFQPVRRCTRSRWRILAWLRPQTPAPALSWARPTMRRPNRSQATGPACAAMCTRSP